MRGNGSEEGLLARVWFIDVGAGDCTLVIDVATKRALLVDCPSWHLRDVQRLLLDEQAILDTVIVTHWDLDHYGGAARLAVGLPVRRILYNHDTLFASEETPRSLIPTILKNFLNVPNADDVLESAEAGQSGAFGSVAWHILAPTHAEVTKAYVARRRNVASAVVDLRVAGLRVLIGGDAVGETWQRLLADAQLDADILRWPHHGADLANDGDGKIRDGVLDAVHPSYVVFSTGARNTHGHPSAGIVERVAARSSVLCTQVTPACFGFISRADRMTSAARSMIEGLPSSYCAGTVYVECLADTYTLMPSSIEHGVRIEQWPQPLCRVGLPTKA
ncbi:MAG: ComEC/Rec2 family competence protein [Streptosporangiaceae bacterium]